MAFGATLRCVREEHLIELGSRHVPRIAALTLVMPAEMKRRRLPPAMIHELYADLLRVAAPLHLLEHAQPLDTKVAGRHERLAHVPSWKPLALHQERAKARLSHQRCHRRPRRPPAHYHAVVLVSNRFHSASSPRYLQQLHRPPPLDDDARRA